MRCSAALGWFLGRGSEKKTSDRGFTLIELLVVTGIMVFITSLVLVNNNRFGGQILLQNLAYDIGLSLRQAQVYGISVRRFGADNFSTGYGMHFARTSPTTYVLFADAVSTNGIYDGCASPVSCELVESTEITRGFYVSGLFVGPASGEVSVNSLDILFKRPEPDACISANDAVTINGAGECTINPNERARIVLSSPRGDEVGIVVEVTGQISVE